MLIRAVTGLTFFAFLLLCSGLLAATEMRTALVLGNGAYRQGALPNPVNDARDMAKSLRGAGFKVVLGTNLDHREMKRKLREFSGLLRQRGGVGLFFYAGHGIQSKGRNYLIPVATDIETEADVEFEALDAGLVLGYMQDSGNSLNVVILDACRDNPFARSFRSISRGLAKVDAPAGSIIAYSTAPGGVAADGEGRNSPYTKNLLRELEIPGQTVEQVFKRTRIGRRLPFCQAACRASQETQPAAGFCSG